MRKLFPLLSVAILFSGVALVWAAEEKTVTGEGQCAKCSLQETKKCQNAIVTEEGGQKVTYYLAQNAISKAFHKNVCTRRSRRSRRRARSRKRPARRSSPPPIKEVEESDRRRRTARTESSDPAGAPRDACRLSMTGMVGGQRICTS